MSITVINDERRDPDFGTYGHEAVTVGVPADSSVGNDGDVPTRLI